MKFFKLATVALTVVLAQGLKAQTNKTEVLSDDAVRSEMENQTELVDADDLDAFIIDENQNMVLLFNPGGPGHGGPGGPGHGGPGGPGHDYGLACFARNGRGVTFRSTGYNISARRLQDRVMYYCRTHSARPNTCRPLGCRAI